MGLCFFVSDLHGRPALYERLFEAVANESPVAVFLGGDLLPHGLVSRSALDPDHRDFINGFLARGFGRLRADLGPDYPRVFLILGNDDPRIEEAAVLDGAARGLWEYLHGRRVAWDGFSVYGYACTPPSPFRLKDWERYDVSRYVDPGCLSPEEGWRTVPVAEHELRHATIQRDLEGLVGDDPLDRAIFLFHAPPYDTCLDRAALDGKSVDHVPLDVHVGSIAIQRFVELRQPRVTLHGHVHESTRLTGSWRQRVGRTHLFSAAHDGPELAIVRFAPEDPARATRELIAE